MTCRSHLENLPIVRNWSIINYLRGRLSQAGARLVQTAIDGQALAITIRRAVSFMKHRRGFSAVLLLDQPGWTKARIAGRVGQVTNVDIAIQFPTAVPPLALAVDA